MNYMIHLWKVLPLALLLALLAIPTVEAQSSASTQALQRLTDDLGLQLKLTYRDDLTAHRERYAEMAAALVAWNRSPRTDADYALMSDWLRTAIRNSMPGTGKPLPAPPAFSVPRPIVAELPTPSTKPAVPKPTVPKPVVEKPQPDSKSVVTKPAPPAVTPGGPGRSAPPVATAEPTKPVPPKDTARPAPRDFWSNHPAAKPLDLSNPFRDDPLPKQPESNAVAVSPSPTLPNDDYPTVRTALRLPVVEASEVAVNLPELSSRIGGYNQGLRRVEAAVIAAKNPNARELAKLLAELDQLADERDFIDLYVVGLSEQERAATPKLDRADAALALLEEMIAVRMKAVAASNSSERDILPALVRKLAELQQGLPEVP